MQNKKEKPISKEISAKDISVDEIEIELERAKRRSQYAKTLRRTLYTLIIVSAVAILVATLWMPVLHIYGDSMTPTLFEGDIVISIKGAKFETGDLISFYYGNRLLVKRVIAGPGDWVDMDEEGNVYVNDRYVDEPYLEDGAKAYGKVTIDFPYQVPEKRFFVLGDHRETSADSRDSIIGCISDEQVVGKIVFCVWPFSDFGSVK